MALDENLQSRIFELTNDHWSIHAHDQSFAEIIDGKEPGHRMADFVDDRTTDLMKVNLDVRYEGNRNGSVKKRSMGDIWVYSQGMFNPLNVKSGLQGMGGQPNLVSMKKLLDYILKRWIDSYYLLIIKFDLSDEITHKTYLVDLLEWTECITYDAGPGQIMLREQEFYQKVESGHRPTHRSIHEKTEILFRLFERQVEALFRNRQARLEHQQEMLQAFLKEDFEIDQSQMRFVL